MWNSKDIQNLRQSVLKLKNSQTEIILERFGADLNIFEIPQSNRPLISYTSNALIDMVEILFLREKVSLNVSKNKLVRQTAVTRAHGVAHSGLWAPA